MEIDTSIYDQLENVQVLLNDFTPTGGINDIIDNDELHIAQLTLNDVMPSARTSVIILALSYPLQTDVVKFEGSILRLSGVELMPKCT